MIPHLLLYHHLLSGKSTLINALVGDELLPMNNVPETARICKVVHCERAQQPYMMEPASSVAPPHGKRASHSDNSSMVEQVRIRIPPLK